jgi:acyl dehydratase
MFREYMQALFKRVDTRKLMQFKPPSLPQRIYTKSISVDNAHYGKYCNEVEWPVSERMHPLYLQMLSLPLQMQCLLDKQSPFPLLGLIHSGNRVSVLLSCDLSEPFECRVRFHDVNPHSRGWEVEVLLEAYQAGQLVYKAISSYLVKVKAVHVAPRTIHSEVVESCNSEEKVTIGEALLPAETGRRYAALSGDFNPIHLSTLSAKLFGFKKPIAHGMFTLARAISAYTANQENPNALEINRVDCRFKKPVFLPNTIVFQQHCETDSSVKIDVTNARKTSTHIEISMTF